MLILLALSGGLPGSLPAESAPEPTAILPAPGGFSVLGTTDTCAVAAMSEPDRRLYALQFHPEVIHTRQGKEILSNFLFAISGCERDWDPKHRIPAIEEDIRRVANKTFREENRTVAKIETEEPKASAAPAKGEQK